MLFDEVSLQTLALIFGEQLQQHVQIIRQRLFSFSWPLRYLITGWIPTPDTL